MKTKIFVPFGIFRLLAMLIALAFAFVSIYMLIISFNPGQSVGLGIAFVSMGIAVMVVCCFVRPIAIFKGNRLILYGNGGDYMRKTEILCSNVKECKICRMRDAKEGIGIPGNEKAAGLPVFSTWGEGSGLCNLIEHFPGDLLVGKFTDSSSCVDII